MRCCPRGCRCSSPRATVSAAADRKLTLCAQSNKSIHGRCSSVGFSTFSRNWTKENMDSVDCQCDSVKFKWTLCSTGPCGRTALVFPIKMSWQNEGPCNIGTASVVVMVDLPAYTCFVFSPFTDQPVALTGIIRSEVSSTLTTRASAIPNLCCVHSTFCCKFCCRSSFTARAGSFSKHPPARLYDCPSFDRKVCTQRIDGRQATPILSSSTSMTSQMTDAHKGTRAVTLATTPVNNVTCASDKTAGLPGT